MPGEVLPGYKSKYENTARIKIANSGTRVSWSNLSPALEPNTLEDLKKLRKKYSKPKISN